MLRFTLAIVTLALVLGIAIAYTGGAPAGTAGAPGQNDCTQCHNSFALNSGNSNFSIITPPSVSPGATVPVTVHFGGSTMPKFGFSMTARSASGSAIGTWQITDPNNTRTIGSEEVGQTSSGAEQSSWTVEWDAPSNLSGPVTFYAAGLEGNDGNGANNDYVYTASTTVFAGPLTLTASSTSGSFTVNVSGGSALAGNEYWVLPTLNTAPGPVLGITPDSLTFTFLLFPPVLPGLHFYLDGSGDSSANYPGALTALTGIPIRLVAFSIDGLQNLTGASSIVTIVP